MNVSLLHTAFYLMPRKASVSCSRIFRLSHSASQSRETSLRIYGPQPCDMELGSISWAHDSCSRARNPGQRGRYLIKNSMSYSRKNCKYKRY